MDLDPDGFVCPVASDGWGMREHVRRLPERQRTAIEAVYLSGYTQEEAAASTGIPLGSLKRHLREGLASLRAALGIRTH